MKIKIFFLLCLIFTYRFSYGTVEVKIDKIQGQVQVRRGVEEEWTPAGINMVLKDIDTILTGETGIVVLSIEKGMVFTLGSNSILDIGDLREITKDELFLYLTSQKVKNLQKINEPTNIHIENVSVVRAEQKSLEKEAVIPDKNSEIKIFEINGAKALFQQEYYTNSIMKFYQILESYSEFNKRGEIYYYLGHSFESIHEYGRARDAYETARQEFKNSENSDPNTQLLEKKSEEASERIKAREQEK
ncbi:MAG: hypothetical protein P8078_06980 [bacterium]